jgi:hypothetical protein
MQDRTIPERIAASAAADAACFEREHRRLHARLQAHLLDLVAGKFTRARLHLQRWRDALSLHLDIEESRLLPHLSANARWPARLYVLEHRRILQLADAHAARLQAAAAHPPRGAPARREVALALLDGVHSLRHVLDHHHQREETTLAHELPAALQQAAWARGRRREAP